MLHSGTKSQNLGHAVGKIFSTTYKIISNTLKYITLGTISFILHLFDRF